MAEGPKVVALAAVVYCRIGNEYFELHFDPKKVDALLMSKSASARWDKGGEPRGGKINLNDVLAGKAPKNLGLSADRMKKIESSAVPGAGDYDVQALSSMPELGLSSDADPPLCWHSVTCEKWCTD